MKTGEIHLEIIAYFGSCLSVSLTSIRLLLTMVLAFQWVASKVKLNRVGLSSSLVYSNEDKTKVRLSKKKIHSEYKQKIN